jgi:hypothetical protein
MPVRAAPFADLLRRFLPALAHQAVALGQQFGHRRVAGHRGQLFLPKIEIAPGELLQIGLFGHAPRLIQATADWPVQ